MNHWRTSVTGIACILLGACSNDLDRERLDLSDLDQRVGTITPLQMVDGIKAESEVTTALKESGANSETGVASIEKIIGGLTEGRVRNIDLPETRRQTLTNNLGLQSALILPEIASQRLRAEEAKFQATFNTSITAQRIVSPVTTPVVGLQNSRSEDIVMAPSLSVPLRTGGSIELDWTLSSNDISYQGEVQAFTTTAPGLRLEQPLAHLRLQPVQHLPQLGPRHELAVHADAHVQPAWQPAPRAPVEHRLVSLLMDASAALECLVDD